LGKITTKSLLFMASKYFAYFSFETEEKQGNRFILGLIC